MMYTDIIYKYATIIIVLPLEKYPQFHEIQKPLHGFLKDTKKNIINMIDYSFKLANAFKEESYDHGDALHIMLGCEIMSTFPKHYVVYQFEQLVAKHDWIEKGLLHKSVLDHYYEQLRNAVEVWDYAFNNIQLLHEKAQINAKYVPFKYSPCMVYPKKVKDIDVCWIGNTAERRKHIIDSLQKEFKAYNTVNCVFGNNDIWNNDEPRVGSIVDLKSDVVARTKIALNIHIHEPRVSSLEVVRILYLLANGCKVVSEPSGDVETDKLYEKMGVVFCDWEDMPKKCMELLFTVS